MVTHLLPSFLFFVPWLQSHTGLIYRNPGGFWEPVGVDGRCVCVGCSPPKQKRFSENVLSNMSHQCSRSPPTISFSSALSLTSHPPLLFLFFFSFYPFYNLFLYLFLLRPGTSAMHVSLVRLPSSCHAARMTRDAALCGPPTLCDNHMRLRPSGEN